MKKYLLLISTAILASCSQGNRDWEPDRSNSCQIIISGDPTIFECAVAVPYRITNEAASKMSDHGLCWNTSGNPTLDDNFASGPDMPENGDDIRQYISGADLDNGQTYYFRAYITANGNTQYSQEVSAQLSGSTLASIELEWVHRSETALPTGIEVYETTSQLDGHEFRAWYAIADCTGNIELRVQKPDGGAQRLADQFTDDCYVLLNGGYFDFGTSAHDGIFIADGISTGTISAQSGDWGGGPAKDYRYNVTRSIFGVDADGHPAFYWAGTAETGQNHFYARPMTSVRYEAQYPAPNEHCPSAPVAWTPRYALSCGPMLLKHGRLMVGSDLDKDQYPVTDWEMWDWALASADYCRAQSAVGCMADGRIVLFTCGLNGEYGTASGGATLKQVAAILKGLGCIDAMKLDCVGSSGMRLSDGTDSSVSTRAVVSTLGFFSSSRQ